LPPILKGGAAGKVVGKLLRDGLIEEVSAAASLRRGAVTMTGMSAVPAQPEIA
jgi:hypothetical protein